MTTELSTIQPPQTAMQSYVFSTAQSFESAQRMATALSKSNLVPKEYVGNMPNALVALEVAQRIGASPLMVMQNLYIVHGRPSWSSQFIIAAINSCGRFKPLRFDITGEGDDRTCIAWTEDNSGYRLESPPVSIGMAKKEGWYSKNGSKWQTMPELMLRYRSASFFGRLYAPDVLMGMYSEDEVRDMPEMRDITPQEDTVAELNAAIRQSTTPHDPVTGEIIEANEVAAESVLEGLPSAQGVPSSITPTIDTVKNMSASNAPSANEKAKAILALLESGFDKIELLRELGASFEVTLSKATDAETVAKIREF